MGGVTGASLSEPSKQSPALQIIVLCMYMYISCELLTIAVQAVLVENGFIILVF